MCACMSWVKIENLLECVIHKILHIGEAGRQDTSKNQVERPAPRPFFFKVIDLEAAVWWHTD